MANIHDCLQRAIDSGDVDKTRGEAAQSEFEQLVARFEGTLPRAQAEVEAARALKEATKARAVSRRHKVIAQVQMMVRLKSIIESAKDPAVALKLLLEWDSRAAAAGFTGESVRSVQEALVATVNAGIQDALVATGRTWTGRSRDPATLSNLIDELHGKDTGDLSAREMAIAVRGQQERLRQLFNAHGGDIGKLADWGVTHTHDAGQILKAGFNVWRDKIVPLLDWSRIVDLTTGKPFASAPGIVPPAAKTDVMLDQIYKSITTADWNTRDPSLSPGGKALYAQHADHRVLHFKDGTAWMEYNAAFGRSDPFTAMMSGLHGMAREIGLMRVLGPNPIAGMEFAIQTATKLAALSTDAKQITRTGKLASRARVMLMHMDGAANVPEDAFWASFMGGVRGVLTGTQLGSAMLSSVTDLVTISMGAKVAGLNPVNVLTRSMKLMVGRDQRALAANAGYIADSLSDMGAAGARMGLDTIMPEVANRISNFTMRASGLSYWTDMNRIAIQMEFGSNLGVEAGRSFDEIAPVMRRQLESRGITAADWDQLRATVQAPRKGLAFITPTYFLKHTTLPRAEAEGLAIRLQMMVQEQLEMMMPTSSVEMKAIVIGESPAGSIRGEVARAALQYKNYGLSMTINQIRRINSLPGPMTKAIYAAAGLSGLTLMGAVSIQLKEMAKGRDPRPMNELRFWFAALLQGGGLGIFGDLLYSNSSRTGGGIGELIAGPVGGLIGDIAEPILINSQAALTGKDTHWGRDLANFVRYNTPVASSLWYGRTVFDRLVADNLQRLLDPDAEKQFRDWTRRQEREMGNSTWWQRGQNLPSRAPDLTNIAGAPQ
jgi:hypothetical protein